MCLVGVFVPLSLLQMTELPVRMARLLVCVSQILNCPLLPIHP